ncbi:MAG: LamG domain-containing protein [Opitutaceae bacterium]|jgi:hypothetical protein|nr:LamG domain-containing protein [Opitutaceae bacterium]
MKNKYKRYNTNKTLIRILPAVLCLPAALCLVPTGLRAQSLLLHYDFNQPVANGTVVTDTSGNGRNGTLAGSAKWGADKTGVSGMAGDHAFDNTASIMGDNNDPATGGALRYGQSMENLTSFTISMWFRTDGTQPLANSARLFDSLSEFLLAGTGDGKASFNLAGAVLAANPDANPVLALAAQNEWVFIAVTWADGAPGQQSTAKIYAGASAQAVSLVASGTSATTGPASLTSLSFGANWWLKRPVDGWLDDIRVYGETSGAAGALSLETLDTIRLAGLNQIPEPATSATVAGGGALLALATCAGFRRLWVVNP